MAHFTKRAISVFLVAILLALSLPLAAFGREAEGIYEGEYGADGKRSGWGVWTYHNYLYVGNWENDMPNGEGTLYEGWATTNGQIEGTDVYRGHWVDGFADGLIMQLSYYTVEGFSYSTVYYFSVVKGFVETNTTAVGLSGRMMADEEVLAVDQSYTKDWVIAGVPPWADANINTSAQVLDVPHEEVDEIYASITEAAAEDADATVWDLYAMYQDGKVAFDPWAKSKEEIEAEFAHTGLAVTPGNLSNEIVSSMVSLGDWIILSVEEYNASTKVCKRPVYKMRADGSQMMKIHEFRSHDSALPSMDFRVVGDQLYFGKYCKYSTVQEPYKMRADDMELTPVEEDFNYGSFVESGWVYTFDTMGPTGTSISKLKLEGSFYPHLAQRTRLGSHQAFAEIEYKAEYIVHADKDWVYEYCGFQGALTDEGNIIRFKTDGSGEMEIHRFTGGEIFTLHKLPQFVGGKVYYSMSTVYWERHNHLYSVDVNFSEAPVLIAEILDDDQKHIAFHVTDDFIYYSEGKIEGKGFTSSIIRVDHDGGNPVALTDEIKGEVEHILIAGDWMLVSYWDGKDRVHTLMRLDGTGLHKVGEPYYPPDAPGITDATGKWRYDLLEDGSAVILGPGSKLKFTGKLEIPKAVDKIPVTAIGDWAFAVCEGFTSVNIPKGVTSIGDYAFQGCGGLTGLTIPEGVTHIGDRAFNWCNRIKKVSLPASLTSIGMEVFGNCPSVSLTVAKKNEIFEIVDGVLFDKVQNVPVE